MEKVFLRYVCHYLLIYRSGNCIGKKTNVTIPCYLSLLLYNAPLKSTPVVVKGWKCSIYSLPKTCIVVEVLNFYVVFLNPEHFLWITYCQITLPTHFHTAETQKRCCIAIIVPLFPGWHCLMLQQRMMSTINEWFLSRRLGHCMTSLTRALWILPLKWTDI